MHPNLRLIALPALLCLAPRAHAECRAGALNYTQDARGVITWSNLCNEAALQRLAAPGYSNVLAYTVGGPAAPRAPHDPAPAQPDPPPEEAAPPDPYAPQDH